MKNAVIVATLIVSAVLLSQAVGSADPVVYSHAAGATITASGAPESPAEFSNALAAKTVPTSTTIAQDPAPVGTTGTVAQTVTVAATASDASITQRTFTTTPATITETPTPTPTPTAPSAPACPAAIGGSTAGAPGASDPSGIPGTTTADIASFASQYNAIRVANCLQPIPFANIRYSSCLQQRLWWMADDPSSDPMSAWGHTGTAVRSDGVPIVGCDGDLAGGDGYTGATVATAWWNSADHRASLYQPLFTGNVAAVCIAFAMSHGGVNIPGPNEPASFVRSAAYWYGC